MALESELYSKTRVEEVATVRFSGATEPIIMLDPEGSEDSIVRSSAPDYGFGDEGKDKVVHNVPPHLAAYTRSHRQFHHYNIKQQSYFHINSPKNT